MSPRKKIAAKSLKRPYYDDSMKIAYTNLYRETVIIVERERERERGES